MTSRITATLVTQSQLILVWVSVAIGLSVYRSIKYYADALTGAA